MQETGYIRVERDGNILRSLRAETRDDRERPRTVYIVGFAERGHRRREREYNSLAEAERRFSSGLPGEPVPPSRQVEISFTSEEEREERTKQHRAAILSLVPEPFRRIAKNQAYTLRGKTGSFSVAIGDNPRDFFDLFSSREIFFAEVAKEREWRSRSRGSHSAKATVGTWRDGMVHNPKARKASLSVEIDSEIAEDVSAQVIRELISLGSETVSSVPCHECERRFDLSTFFAEAEEKVETPEQRERLNGLRLAERSGEIAEACPILWHLLGISPPRTGDANSPYASDRGRPCGMKSLAYKYSWRVAFRYVYQRGRDAFHAGEAQDSNGEIIEYEAEAERSPEELLIEEEALILYQQELERRIRERTTKPEPLISILRRNVETGEAPSGEEIAEMNGVSAGTAYNQVSRLYQIAREELVEMNVLSPRDREIFGDGERETGEERRSAGAVYAELAG